MKKEEFPRGRYLVMKRDLLYLRFMNEKKFFRIFHVTIYFALIVLTPFDK